MLLDAKLTLLLLLIVVHCSSFSAQKRASVLLQAAGRRVKARRFVQSTKQAAAATRVQAHFRAFRKRFVVLKDMQLAHCVRSERT